MEPSQALKKYEDYYIFEKGLSKNTFLAYHKDLTILCNFLLERNKKNMEDIDLPDLLDFIEIRNKQITRKSSNREKSSIKNFLSFCYNEEIISKDFSHLLQQDSNEDFFPEVLTQEEIQNLLEYSLTEVFNHEKESLKYRIAYRDQLMLEILYALGLRVSELVGLVVNDIDLEEGWCKVCGKGNKIRIVPILNPLKEKITHYQKNILPLFKPQKPNLFLNKNGRILSRVSVWKWIKELAQKNQIHKNISPHTFRHTCATHLIQNGADIRIVQELVGHANIQTTELYTHLLNEDVKNTFEKYHPLYY